MNQIFERVTAALATLRVGAADSEEQLHRQAAEAFANAGLEAAHEVSLAPRCRIDFMVGDIGVEIKKKRPQRAPLVAQLTRYANCPQVAAAGCACAARRGPAQKHRRQTRDDDEP